MARGDILQNNPRSPRMIIFASPYKFWIGKVAVHIFYTGADQYVAIKS
jgi:hypothetical protein